MQEQACILGYGHMGSEAHCTLKLISFTLSIKYLVIQYILKLYIILYHQLPFQS